MIKYIIYGNHNNLLIKKILFCILILIIIISRGDSLIKCRGEYKYIENLSFDLL
jgi:hypothetical protein